MPWFCYFKSDSPDVSSTFLQPFVAYTTKDAWTFTLNTESTFDRETDEWSVPINAQVSKIGKLGKLPVSLFAGVRYWTVSPEDGRPERMGRAWGNTFLLPKA